MKKLFIIPLLFISTFSFSLTEKEKLLYVLKNALISKEDAPKLMKIAEKSKDPVYSLRNIIGDFVSYLRGNELDPQGNFANKFGQGKTRQMNALMSQQQSLIGAGMYQDMSDPHLIKERQKVLESINDKDNTNSQ